MTTRLRTAVDYLRGRLLTQSSDRRDDGVRRMLDVGMRGGVPERETQCTARKACIDAHGVQDV